MTTLWLVVGFICGTGTTLLAQSLRRAVSRRRARLANHDAPDLGVPSDHETVADVVAEMTGHAEAHADPPVTRLAEPDETSEPVVRVRREQPDDQVFGTELVPGQAEPAHDLAAGEVTEAIPRDADVPTQLLLEERPALPPAIPNQPTPPEEVPAAPPPAPATAPALAWLRGPTDFLLSRLVTVIGRGSSCDLVFHDEQVSRRHCLIANDGQDWWLEPLRTHNGTYLNRHLLEPEQPVRLRSGDVVGLGGAIECSFIQPDTGRSRAGRLALHAFGHSVVGGRRVNEDRFLCHGGMVAVADGVGGRPAGALAASLAVTGVRDGGPDQDLEESARRLNELIRAHGEQDVLAAGLATTLDVAVLREHRDGFRVSGLHVGDGTVLMQRDAEPMSLVRAHSSSAARSQGGGVLLQAVGLTETVEPDSWEVPAAPGQRFLLASDGLVNALGHQELTRALVRLRARPPHECVNTLLQLATDANAADNVTVVVADVVLSEDD